MENKMIIDCKDLPCPQPVLNTKNALQELGDAGVLEVKINSNAAKENISRFVSNYGYSVDIDEKEDEILLTITKGFTCDAVIKKEEKAKVVTDGKTLFVKTDKIGEGELGQMLMVGFIGNILEQEKLPKKIIFVNEGVLLPTSCNDTDIVKSLKALEEKGVELFACGMCLKHFDIEEKLKVGKIGNAHETVGALLNDDIVSL